ncbi:hypothetical protein ACFYUV_38045 [Nonomuraea sp. NPDC003560]|uniref:hypothetical protein n=1 Tax=Nonomuraea sp. NPDC003560 TaxID=3364341 RepID=UPI0036901D7D
MQPDIIQWLLGTGGVGGGLLVLFLKGYLAAKPHLDALRAEITQWRKLYESERAAHDLTRKAHAEGARAELLAAAEGSRAALAMMEEIKARQSEAPR